MTELLRWTRSFAGVMSEIPIAAHWVEEIAEGQGIRDDLAYALQVCLEELLTNIVRHGAASPSAAHAGPSRISDGPPECQVTLDVEPDGVRLIVEDDGNAFDVAAAPGRRIDPPLSQIEPGGLGIQLIKSFAGTLAYERAGLGNRVTIDFVR